eukprot:m.239143 g.239143  ORF g.239143 m.239143 type:complete len:400 (-) comp22329_c0_seq1:109-1308(-)
MDEINSDTEIMCRRQQLLSHSMLTSMDHMISMVGDSLRAAQGDDAAGFGVTVRKLATTAKEENTKINAEIKDFIGVLAKLGKSIDKTFFSNPAKSANPDAFKGLSGSIHKAISEHLCFDGKFDVVETFARESDGMLTEDHALHMKELSEIRDALLKHNLAPALRWIDAHERDLTELHSPLSYNAHRLAFIQLLTSGKIHEAIIEAQQQLSRLAGPRLDDLKHLMGAVLYANRLSSSSYRDILSPTLWTDLHEQLVSAYCTIGSLPRESPLSRCINTGCRAIPVYQKISKMLETAMSFEGNALTALGKRDVPFWEAIAETRFEFPTAVEPLSHTVFCCPVSKDLTTPQNPPMRLPCGHVISREILTTLARSIGHASRQRRFKCPYCPQELVLADTVEVHF